jgi:hypothetical protein
MRRSLANRIGTGTVWIEADHSTGAFLCSWRHDAVDSEPFESERMASEAGAVAWGRSRTPLVVLRTGDATYWAGDGTPTVEVDAEWSDAGDASTAGDA